MAAIRSRYFHLVFERIFSDVPFLRSPRHKVRMFFIAKNTESMEAECVRVGLHKCFASHRIKKELIYTTESYHTASLLWRM
jgi:hypothetical protein